MATRPARRERLFALVGLRVGALTAFPPIVFGIQNAHQLPGRIMHIMA